MQPRSEGLEQVWSSPDFVVSADHSRPFVDARRGLVIAADMRLDNAEELLQALGLPPSASELELLAEGFRRWGVELADRLLGDFAFVIFSPAEKSLYCARDPMGVRPFYYCASDQRLAFASTPRMLLSLLPERPGWNEPFIANYLQQLGYDRLESTFFEGVKRLRPGAWMQASPETFRLHRYWTPGPHDGVRFRREADYAHALLELVDDAVRRRVKTELTVGSHLSGGLDCSAVAVLAARHLKRRGREIQTFSWSRPPEPDLADWKDERYRIEQVCAQEGLTCHYSVLTEEDRLADRFKDPSLDPDRDMLHERVVQRNAVAGGVQLMLSGWGGDEFASFDGRGGYSELLLTGRWLRLVAECREAAGHPLGVLWRRGLVPLLPDSLFDRLRPDRGGETYIDADFAARMHGRWAFWPTRLRELPRVKQNMMSLLAVGHFTERIEAWHLSGMARGIAYTYPLLDRRIIEFCLGLPSDLFLREGRRRSLFRKALEGVLPRELLWGSPKLERATFGRLPPVTSRGALPWKEKEQPYVDVERVKAVLRTSKPAGAFFHRALRCLRLGDGPADRRDSGCLLEGRPLSPGL